MTVGTMLFGLIPLLWATGSGADVMKRIAAPMVGGLLTSAFLTLELIPVISTYWRQEQLLWEKLEPLDPRRLMRLKAATALIGAGAVLGSATVIAPIYAAVSSAFLLASATVAVVAMVGGTVAYLVQRPTARRLVWPGNVPAQSGAA